MKKKETTNPLSWLFAWFVDFREEERETAGKRTMKRQEFNGNRKERTSEEARFEEQR